MAPSQDSHGKVDDKLVDLPTLCRLRREHADAGRSVVQCHGCFDVLHPGHVRYLRFAREQGDILIVSVTSDRHVSKGVDRPHVDENLRAESIAALEFVDHVVIDDNAWAGPVLDAVRPDVYVKGREYETNEDPRFARERALVEGHGGRVIFSSGEVVYSSTEIISRWHDRRGPDRARVPQFCRRNGVTGHALDSLLRSFQGVRLLVVGDPIFDVYRHCHLVGAAAEGPLLTVNPMHEDWYLGGAALVATQAVALGAEATLLTCARPSESRERFITALRDRGVEVCAVDAEGRGIYKKTRYLVEDRKVLKVDEGRYAPVSTTDMRAFVSELNEQLAKHDALAAIDFGYGLFGPSLLEAIEILSQRHRRPVYADVSGSAAANLLNFRGARLCTPSEHELRQAFADQESGLPVLAKRYQQVTRADGLVITMGRRGLVAFHRPSSSEDRIPSEYLPSLATHAIDTVGAGDVLFAALVLSDVVRAPSAMGLYLGSCLSALKVERLGNLAVSLPDLESFLASRPELDTSEHTHLRVASGS